jgi:hypothetical protein
VEEAIIEESYPSIDPMGPVTDMDLATAREALLKLQAIVSRTLNELPAGNIPSHTIDDIPDSVNHYVCEAAYQNRNREDLEEEIGRLRKVISQIAENLGNGSTVSEESSIGFIEELPKEVKLVVAGLTKSYVRVMRDHYKRLLEK